ncbi:RNA 3'-terminal phosphate cyclase [Thermosulfuriphilus sp.]
MIHIDGSYGEGGGQILRSALALSIITGKAFFIKNIRARRKNPGLRPQHRACVKAAVAISEAKVQGAQIGSQKLFFSPQKIKGGRYRFEITSAGSTGLVFQTLYLPLLLADRPSRITITGGTHVPMAPCYHYLALVFAPFVRQINLSLDLELIRWGFYPSGGGEIQVDIFPSSSIIPFCWTEDFYPQKLWALSVVSDKLPDHISKRQALRLARRLEALKVPHEIQTLRVKSQEPGTVVFLLAQSKGTQAGFTAVGLKGKPAEVVADEAVDSLNTFLNTRAPIDEHLADQIVLPASLAKGESRYRVSRISQHLLTNLWVVKHFLEIDFEIQGQEGKSGEIIIRGAGLS